MKRISIVVLVILGFIFFLAGCAKPPVEKGVLYTAENWDLPPAFHGNPWAPGGNSPNIGFYYEPLFVYIPTTREWISRLGESFEESADHKSLTVKLRENVLWHDGERFSSRDVKTTFDIAYIKKYEIWNYLDKVEAPDENTVVFYWKTPSPLNNVRALTEFISSPYHIFGKWSEEIPKIKLRRESAAAVGDVDEAANNENERLIREGLYKFHPQIPIGTGPFKVKKVTASDIILEKFEEHYDAASINIKQVHVMRWGSNEKVWSYLISGQMDAVTPACPFDVATQIMKRNPGVKLITPSDMSEGGLIINCDKAPMNDLNFRKAVAHVVDRDMVRKIAYYYADTNDDYSMGIPMSMRKHWLDEEFMATLTKYDVNYDKARQILTDAGYQLDSSSGKWKNPDGSPITIDVIAPQNLNDLILIGEVATNSLKKFGINAQLRTVPQDQFLARIKGKDYHLAAENGTQFMKYGDPAFSYARYYEKDGLIKVGSGIPSVVNYKGQDINTEELVKQLMTEMDETKRKEMIKTLAWITNENLPFLACYEKRVMIFLQDGKRVEGWPDKDNHIWEGIVGGNQNMYSTVIVKGMIKSVP